MSPSDASGDRSEGYDAIAETYIGARSDVGADCVRDWARRFVPNGGRVLDVGCGDGEPITAVLIEFGFDVYAMDASARMLGAFRERFPDVPTRHEAVQDAQFFGIAFDAVVAIGLIFLLSGEEQGRALANLARALKPGGHMLFSAPWQEGEWNDVLTGRRSVSLGVAGYTAFIEGAGMELVETISDDGENHHYVARKL